MKSLSLYNRENILYEPDSNIQESWHNYGGDFLWIAPQERWGWPPIKEFDQMSWTVWQDEGVSVQSPEWQGVQLFRQYDFSDINTLKVINRMTVLLSQPQTWGLWNISQVPVSNLAVIFNIKGGIKVFDYPPGVKMENLKGKGIITSLSNETMELKTDPQAHYKIGCLSDESKFVFERNGVQVTKSHSYVSDNKQDRYPHGCHFEFYQERRYCELEMLWPMVTLSDGEYVEVEQYYTINEVGES